jgi:uncharacterized membrane protein YfcA
VTSLPGLSALGWAAVVLALLLVGFSKTAVAGVGTIAVAVLAIVLPAKESTGALLPLLLVGDCVAVATYRQHADWGRILRLLPWVAVGIVVGAVAVGTVDDRQMRILIGGVLLFLLVAHLLTARTEVVRALTKHPVVVGPVGALAGSTTMIANAGGPVMALYLLAARKPVLEFLGTSAWFFFLVNLAKVPFSVGLGLITPASLLFDALLVPAVLAGALVGRLILRRLDRAWFERVTLVLTAVAAVRLLW